MFFHGSAIRSTMVNHGGTIPKKTWFNHGAFLVGLAHSVYFGPRRVEFSDALVVCFRSFFSLSFCMPQHYHLHKVLTELHASV